MSDSYTNEIISLKDLILRVQDYIKFLWTKKWWILLISALAGAFFVYRVYDRPATYNGSIVFTINIPDAGSSLGGVGSILGQIGLGGSAENPLIKVRALGQTYNVISKCLLDSVVVSGQHDMVANHLIRQHKFNETILVEMDEDLEGFYFQHNRFSDFNLDEQKVLKFLYWHLRDPSEGLLEASEEQETGTITYELTTNSPDLTVELLDRLYNNLKDTYVEQSISPQLNTLQALTIKADSIKKALTSIEYQLASMQDRTLGLTSSRQLVQQANLQREANVLNGTYVEVLRNKETADFMLKTAKPDLQVVQSPILPLRRKGVSYPLNAIFGAIFGGVFGVIGFSLLKAYRDIMTDETKEYE